MLFQTIFSVFLFTFVSAEGFINSELNKYLCDTDGSFREEFIKCLKTMPSEIQDVLISCGAKEMNETTSDYNRIIDETCVNTEYSDKVSHCVKKNVKQHHNLELEDNDEHDHPEHHEDEGHTHEEHHDHNNEEGESEEATEHKDCLGDLYLSYNITTK